MCLIYYDRISKQKNIINGQYSHKRVEDILNFITRNFHEQYSLSDVSKMAKISQRQFTNLCRKITGKSYIQFLNSLRCEKAKEMLSKTDMSVSTIGFQIGFEDLYTFYRAFKRHCNKSPLNYKDSF